MLDNVYIFFIFSARNKMCSENRDKKVLLLFVELIILYKVKGR